VPANMFGTKLSRPGKVVEADFRRIPFLWPASLQQSLRPYVRDSSFTFGGQNRDDNASTRDYSRAS
jgi:hypothetical protein